MKEEKKHLATKNSSDIGHINSIYTGFDPSNTYFAKEAHSQYLTFADKLTPIIKAQENINQTILKITESNSIMMKSALDPIKSFASNLGSAVGNLKNLSITGDYLIKPISYNFVSEPISSSLNIAAENIASIQSGLMKTISLPKVDTFNLGGALDFTKLRTPDLSLSNISLGTMQESVFFRPAVFIPPTKEDENARRIKVLEDEINKIKKSEEKVVLSQITENLEALLKELDPALAKIFKGAVAVILNPNDDSIAQSAESMTRLLEILPTLLAPSFTAKNKKTDRKEMLAIYLGIEYTDISKVSHTFIERQHEYYEVFSQIRHRNKGVYHTYTGDYSLYKALLIQAEGFIYQLIVLPRKVSKTG